MINFTYHNPTEIIFGKNQITQLNDKLKPYENDTILLVYGKESIKKLGIYDTIMEITQTLNINVIEEAGVRPNPSMDSVYSGREKARKHDCKFVLAAGGGSVIDAAKAIAFSVYLDKDDVWDVFLFEKEAKKALPIGVVLTLAATGTESNGNTVVTNDQTKEKRSVAYPFLFPKFSIIDPSYTLSVNKHYTIAGAVDIIMHVFEQYFSNTERTETADYMSTGIIKSVIDNVKRYLDGDNSYDTRANLSWAATIGLNWILQQGKVGDWATHRLSYPVTQVYGVTHGFALTALFPTWLDIALKENQKTMTRRLNFLGQEIFLTKSPEATIEAIRDLFKLFGAPTNLKDAGIDASDKDIEALATTAVRLGPVGTVMKIDERLAKEIFRQANC
ncbi:MAG: iron-containing alcohol dehydrogenase [Bacillota bacterium]